jgi:hypothetical protein
MLHANLPSSGMFTPLTQCVEPLLMDAYDSNGATSFPLQANHPSSNQYEVILMQLEPQERQGVVKQRRLEKPKPAVITASNYYVGHQYQRYDWLPREGRQFRVQAPS